MVSLVFFCKFHFRVCRRYQPTATWIRWPTVTWLLCLDPTCSGGGTPPCHSAPLARSTTSPRFYWTSSIWFSLKTPPPCSFLLSPSLASMALSIIDSTSIQSNSINICTIMHQVLSMSTLRSALKGCLISGRLQSCQTLKRNSNDQVLKHKIYLFTMYVFVI